MVNGLRMGGWMVKKENWVGGECELGGLMDSVWVNG